jgi:hypothetical protein
MSFLALVLISGPLPSRQQRKDYCAALSLEGELLSADSFCKVSAWFDQNEGADLFASQKQINLNESTDGEEQLDEQRIKAVKTLIYKTYKVPNKEGMMTADFVADVNALFPDSMLGDGTDHKTL